MTHPPEVVQKEKLNGILLINKAQGFSSNAVLQRVKYLLGACKAGHTGSLDPLATGMLPICFGEATKLSQYLLDADKVYTATGRLGIKTSSADAMGEVIAEVKDFDISIDQLNRVLSEFTGKIKQIPSMFSALKHQGTPLYKLARKGLEIDREPRDIIIYDLKLIQFNGCEFQVKVRCSKGTYIRNLIEDIGERLGVGAHVIQLHRNYTAGFSSNSMIAVDTLAEMTLQERRSLLLPMESAIAHLPRVSLSTEQAQQLYFGQTIKLQPLVHSLGIVQLYENDLRFLGLGEWMSTGELKAKRLIANEPG